jgi:glycosyltransferase involved in cell wall biosynthesis
MEASNPAHLQGRDVMATRQISVSIIAPCYNEELNISYLESRLKEVSDFLRETYSFHFIFVDDGSTDKTWQVLNQVFGNRRDCTLLRHSRNSGITAALLTGIKNSSTEIVCTIDSDCSCELRDLKKMIPLVEKGADMVSASPYHPDGKVRNVPSWRLLLSKTASLLYRQILTHKSSTYTSCFRVCRKSAIVPLKISQPGFQGIVEMLARLDLAGGHIVEFPTVLDVRKYGSSKMRIARTVVGHLCLMMKLIFIKTSMKGSVHGSNSQI